MASRTRRVAVAGLVAAAVLAAGLAGCTGQAPAPSPSPSVSLAPLWRSYFDQALNDPSTSAFMRRVLSDYRITDAEYHESRVRFQQCMADRGWAVSLNDGGGFTIGGAPGGPHASVDPSDPAAVKAWASAQTNDRFACDASEMGPIEPIYLGTRSSPRGLTYAQEVRACFQAHGVPDGADLSDDEFARMLDDGGFRASTPAGKLCVYDPTGEGGLTQDQAVSMDAEPRVTVTADVVCGPGVGCGGAAGPVAWGTAWATP